MKKLVGIFAHPDDEAFGPGGTIAKFAVENEVYLICVTNGDAQQEDQEKEKQLGELRKKELEESCQILGVKKVFFLGYRDGSLCHNVYHELAQKLQGHLEQLRPETIMTFEPRGVSGHIDHIVVSMVTSYVFNKLSFIKQIYYFCNSIDMTKLIENYFIYVPNGYTSSEVQKIIDVSDVWDTKVAAMHKHLSQKDDVQKVLGWLSQIPKEEYFLVVKK